MPRGNALDLAQRRIEIGELTVFALEVFYDALFTRGAVVRGAPRQATKVMPQMDNAAR